MRFIKKIYSKADRNFVALPNDTFKKWVREPTGEYVLCSLSYWQDMPDFGNQFYPGKEYSIGNTYKLYAKYPQDGYSLIYYCVNGMSERETIVDYKIMLKKPSYANFQGWWLTDQTLCEPDTETGKYPTYELTGDDRRRDIIAREQVQNNYVLSYDSSGAVGSIEPVGKRCVKYVQYIEKSGKGHVTTLSETVQLADGKSYYEKVSPKTGKQCIFSEWKIDGSRYKPGSSVRMTSNYTAYAIWLYQPAYRAVVKQYVNESERDGCADISITDDPADDAKKTLAITSIGSAYKFIGWYQNDAFISAADSICVQVSPKVSPSESEYEQVGIWQAKFAIDARKTIVMRGSDYAIVDCTGTLTRKMLSDC